VCRLRDSSRLLEAEPLRIPLLDAGLSDEEAVLLGLNVKSVEAARVAEPAQVEAREAAASSTVHGLREVEDWSGIVQVDVGEDRRAWSTLRSQSFGELSSYGCQRRRVAKSLSLALKRWRLSVMRVALFPKAPREVARTRWKT
jgi:hypothetical protein